MSDIDKELIDDMQRMGLDVSEQSSPIDLHRAAQDMYLVLMYRIQKEINKDGKNK